MGTGVGGDAVRTLDVAQVCARVMRAVQAHTATRSAGDNTRRALTISCRIVGRQRTPSTQDPTIRPARRILRLDVRVAAGVVRRSTSVKWREGAAQSTKRSGPSALTRGVGDSGEGTRTATPTGR